MDCSHTSGWLPSLTPSLPPSLSLPLSFRFIPLRFQSIKETTKQDKADCPCGTSEEDGIGYIQKSNLQIAGV